MVVVGECQPEAARRPIALRSIHQRRVQHQLQECARKVAVGTVQSHDVGIEAGVWLALIRMPVDWIESLPEASRLAVRMMRECQSHAPQQYRRESQIRLRSR